MTKSRILGISTTVMVVLVSTAWAQAPKGLTARELFYTAPAAAKAPAAPQRESPTPVKPAPIKVAQKEQVVAKAVPKPKEAVEHGPAPARRVETEARLPGGGSLVKASASSVPLGLRYSILKYTSDDEYVEVDPDYSFRSGDKIRLRVEVNDAGYLYVVMQGTSGAWRVMFPAPEIDAGSNYVAPGKRYDLPGRTRLFFDEQAGTEKLFVVLSRQPLKEIDQLIYELDGSKREQPASAAGSQKTMMASAAIGDSMVARMRNGVMARDLVFEKVDESKPAPTAAGGRKETATYVVNASLASDSRLVADISLKHR